MAVAWHGMSSIVPHTSRTDPAWRQSEARQLGILSHEDFSPLVALNLPKHGTSRYVVGCQV